MAISGHLQEIFTISWPVSSNISVASSPPCLAPMSSLLTRGEGQGKGHPLFSLSGKTPPIEMTAHRVLPQSFLDFIVQGSIVWVFGMTSFLSKRDSVLCIRVRQ